MVISISNNKAINYDLNLYNSNSLEFVKSSNGSIYAGESIKKITPNLENHYPIFLAGFDRNRKATDIHDDLWSRCCCSKIGDLTFAIVSVDLIGIMYHEYLQIIEKIPFHRKI